MHDVLTVPTPFGDLAELSAGLADRIEAERLILYGPNLLAEGDFVQFSVLLLDGSPALAGRGRVAASVDWGVERDPETRFDIVVDELQLDARSEVFFERIVYARTSDEPATGETAVPEDDFGDNESTMAVDGESLRIAAANYDRTFADPYEKAAAKPAAKPAAEPVADFGMRVDPVDGFADFDDEDEEATRMRPEGYQADLYAPKASAAALSDSGLQSVSGESLLPPAPIPRAAEAPEMPAAPTGFVLSPPPPGTVLTRPVQPATWWPEAAEHAPSLMGEYFFYDSQLPVPSVPPRPEMDPEYVVSLAPQPGQEFTPNFVPLVNEMSQPGGHYGTDTAEAHIDEQDSGLVDDSGAFEAADLVEDSGAFEAPLDFSMPSEPPIAQTFEDFDD